MARPTPTGIGYVVWDLTEVTSGELRVIVEEADYKWLAFYVGYGEKTDAIMALLEQFSRELREDKPIGVPMGIVMRVDPQERPSDYDPSAKRLAVFYGQAKHEPEFIVLHIPASMLHSDAQAVESFYNRVVAGQIGAGKADGFIMEYPDLEEIDVELHVGPTGNLRYLAKKFRFAMLPSPEGHHLYVQLLKTLRSMGEPLTYPIVANEGSFVALDAATQDALPQKKVVDPDAGVVDLTPKPPKLDSEGNEISLESGVPPMIIQQLQGSPDMHSPLPKAKVTDPPDEIVLSDAMQEALDNVEKGETITIIPDQELVTLEQLPDGYTIQMTDEALDDEEGVTE